MTAQRITKMSYEHTPQCPAQYAWQHVFEASFKMGLSSCSLKQQMQGPSFASEGLPARLAQGKDLRKERASHRGSNVCRVVPDCKTSSYKVHTDNDGLRSGNSDGGLHGWGRSWGDSGRWQAHCPVAAGLACSQPASTGAHEVAEA